ncbi:hypothetical protein pb186bvf_015523 [Paramecium bursaria]
MILFQIFLEYSSHNFHYLILFKDHGHFGFNYKVLRRKNLRLLPLTILLHIQDRDHDIDYITLNLNQYNN